jgi:hypothetical protein
MSIVTYQPALEGEALASNGGKWTTTVAATAIAAGVVVIKAAPGRLCKILVTTATTASQAITIYDNATAGSGTIVAVIPGSSVAGLVVEFQMPCNNGISIAQNASLAAGAITISWV